jgi:hypothetical protein
MNKLCLLLILLSSSAVAQDAGQQDVREATANEAVVTDNTSVAKPAVIGEANINLRTTVTGNQEQPRVMYILPWQSPLSPELEMEMLGSEADSVFGHLERDELQRNLEAAGELDVRQ